MPPWVAAAAPAAAAVAASSGNASTTVATRAGIDTVILRSSVAKFGARHRPARASCASTGLQRFQFLMEPVFHRAGAEVAGPQRGHLDLGGQQQFPAAQDALGEDRAGPA